MKEFEKYPINIAAIQEIRWKGNGILENDITLFTIVATKNSIFGAGLSWEEK